mmetsp:Transcript_114359/g.214194  ORF Transcript_114359/g.214194 Transcript_114359/m.214194 type:complete len:187 (+) Transcript_114359:91-651(+)
MGYAGYSPGANSRMADSLTPLQQALRALPLDVAPDTLALIEKLTRNVVRNPGEEKFRKINLTNTKIKAAIADVPNGIELMQEMGWVPEGESLILPAGIRLAHEVHVVGIIEAQDHYKSEAEKERVRQMRARKEVDGDKDKLRQQLEADRKEKAAEGPVSKASVAQKRGEGNIVRASDLGIGQSAGG